MNHPARLLTIGHSTLAAAAFMTMLTAHGVELIADVRRFPASRRHPQFHREALAEMLVTHGSAYLHLPELGGRREPKPDSPNTAWREAGFRGYADHMETAEFRRGITRLLEAARARPTAIMCAEKSWRNCHRGLIADHLKASAIEVIHILDAAATEPHPWTAPARLIHGRLTYTTPGIDQQELLF
ncbi:MAG TPA: DUF488 domain-containing protein [Burkholderiales bacterium]|nr:DUF488 domain-containing protein [Burkholderiales bacterium]